MKKEERAAYLRALSDVRGKLEEMMIKNPKCYCKTHPEHNCLITSNEAFSDALWFVEELSKQK